MPRHHSIPREALIYSHVRDRGDSGLAPERGAGAGATRSRGPTCGDATVEPAEARRPPSLARLRGRIPKGTLLRPPTRPLGDATVQARARTRLAPALHPAPGSHPSGKPDGTCSALRGRARRRGRRVAGLHKEEPAQASARIARVPQERRQFIGLGQVRRLLRCAPCQGTYLGGGATPCSHPHLTQRASRE
jgi:hypothetical protein